MTITINGRPRDCVDGETLAQALRAFAPEIAQRTGGVAIAVNGGVVPRAQWESHVLADDDAVEIVTAFAGG